MAIQTGLTYAELALRDEHPYLCRFIFEDGMRWCVSKPTLSEAIVYIDGDESAELLAVDELVPGLASERKLADVVFGQWFLVKGEKELDMAKVKDAVKNGGSGRDVVDDLLGDSRKTSKAVKKVAEQKAVKAAAKKGVAKKVESNGAGRRAAFEDTDTIKVKAERNVRAESKDGKQWSLLKSGMRVRDWKKSCDKAKVGDNCNGMLSYFVRKGWVAVV